MILSKSQAFAVKRGSKTRITRPKVRRGAHPKAEPITVRHPDGSEEQLAPNHFAPHRTYEVGEVIAIQHTVEEKRTRAPGVNSTDRRWREETRQRAETVCHAKITAVYEGSAHELDDKGAQAEGFKGRTEFLDWWRETYGVRPEVDTVAGPRQIECPVVVICIQVLDEHFLGPGHRRPTDERGYHGKPVPEWRDEPQPVDDQIQEQISSGMLRSDAQHVYDAERSQEAAARLARPPEEQLVEELEAMRRESPRDAARFEAQAVDLARRIAAKRRRRAA